MKQDTSLKNSIVFATGFAALLWVIKLLESISGIDLYSLGVYPRALSGTIGIATAPLIHGSWQHLFGNTLPLVLLGTMLIYAYPRSRWLALSGIWLLSGLGVWLMARSSYHFGASGLTHGMFFYLFVGGFLRKDKRSAAILMVVFYMYGGMLLTIFPRDPSVSFESHLSGALAGALFAYLFRHWDLTPRKRYSWERRADELLDEEDDPVIGDQWRVDDENKGDRFI